jgi:hypothetical protein
MPLGLCNFSLNGFVTSHAAATVQGALVCRGWPPGGPDERSVTIFDFGSFNQVRIEVTNIVPHIEGMIPLFSNSALKCKI